VVVRLLAAGFRADEALDKLRLLLRAVGILDRRA